METRTDVLNTDQIAIGPDHGAHVRRRAARAAALEVLPSQVDVDVPAHAQHPRQRPDPQRGDGHGDRVAAGHRDGAAGRHRRHPQEPVDRGAGVGGGPRQALRERHDRQPDHALARRNRIYEALELMKKYRISRRADHRGRRARKGGWSASSRTAICGSRRNLDRPIADIMTREHLITVPVGTTLEQAREIPAPPQGREAAGRRRPTSG